MRQEADPKRLAELENEARALADVLGGYLKKATGERTGLAVLMVSLDGPEAAWINNADSAGMMRMMKDFIGCLKSGGSDEPADRQRLSRPGGGVDRREHDGAEQAVVGKAFLHLERRDFDRGTPDRRVSASRT